MMKKRKDFTYKYFVPGILYTIAIISFVMAWAFFTETNRPGMEDLSTRFWHIHLVHFVAWMTALVFFMYHTARTDRRRVKDHIYRKELEIRSKQQYLLLEPRINGYDEFKRCWMTYIERARLGNDVNCSLERIEDWNKRSHLLFQYSEDVFDTFCKRLVELSGSGVVDASNIDDINNLFKDFGETLWDKIDELSGLMIINSI